MTSVRDLQKPLRQRYKERPEDSVKRYRLKSSGANLSDTFHSTVTSLEGAGAGSSFAVAVDPKLGGPGGAPTPGDLLLASYAACQDSSLRMVANAMGIELTALSVEVTGDVDLRGTLMLDKTVPVGFGTIHCQVELGVPASTTPEQVARLVEVGQACCVIGATLKTPPQIEVVVRR